jgi:hypothetical protein
MNIISPYLTQDESYQGRGGEPNSQRFFVGSSKSLSRTEKSKKVKMIGIQKKMEKKKLFFLLHRPIILCV